MSSSTLPCDHQQLHQVTEAVLRTTWNRQNDGSYSPDVDYKVMFEETGTFTCVDCGVEVSLDAEALHVERL